MASKFVEALEKATEGDLLEIDAEIATIRARLEFLEEIRPLVVSRLRRGPTPAVGVVNSPAPASPSVEPEPPAAKPHIAVLPEPEDEPVAKSKPRSAESRPAADPLSQKKYLKPESLPGNKRRIEKDGEGPHIPPVEPGPRPPAGQDKPGVVDVVAQGLLTQGKCHVSVIGSWVRGHPGFENMGDRAIRVAMSAPEFADLFECDEMNRWSLTNVGRQRVQSILHPTG
jgi:hypothetical protein